MRDRKIMFITHQKDQVELSLQELDMLVYLGLASWSETYFSNESKSWVEKWVPAQYYTSSIRLHPPVDADSFVL